MALPALAEARDSVFADKKREALAAWARLHAIYEDQEPRLDALGKRPKLPERLCEPMLLMDKGKRAMKEAPEFGWDAEELARITNTGMTMTVECFKRRDDGGTVRVGRKRVSAKTRRQAAELLSIRQDYDAACKAIHDKADAIEAEGYAPLKVAVDLGFALMAYPVSTLAEVRDKMDLAKEWNLVDMAEDAELVSMWNDLHRDVLAAAERQVAHA